MTKRTIIISHEVELEQAGDLMDSVFRSSSPWIGTMVTDTEKKTVTLTYDGAESAEGSLDETIVITFEKIIDSFGVALKEYPNALCCSEDMLSEGLGYGCAQDADVVLQFAVLGELIYG